MGLFDFLKRKESKTTSEKEKVEEPKVTEPQPVQPSPVVEERKEEPQEQKVEEPTEHPAEKFANSVTLMSLEELFEKAFVDTQLRTDFYRRLMVDNVFILTSEDVPAEGDVKEKRLKIAQLSDGKIPVFTSEKKVYDNDVIKEKQSVMAIPCRKLFEITKGASYVLNPFSKPNKVMLPQEIEWLLNGADGAVPVEKKDANQPRRVRVGYPSDFPQEMVDALNQKLVAYPAVLAVYIGLMEILDSNEQPRYVFGVHANGINQEIAKAIGETAAPFLKGKSIEIMAVDPEKKEGLADYFLSTTPIYKSQAQA